MKPKILSFCIGLFALHLAGCKDSYHIDENGGNIITSSQAIQYIGLTKTVEGKVVSAKYSSESKNAPTFLNLDKKYPNHQKLKLEVAHLKIQKIKLKKKSGN